MLMSELIRLDFPDPLEESETYHPHVIIGPTCRNGVEDYSHGSQPFVPIFDPSFFPDEAFSDGYDCDKEYPSEEAEEMRTGLNPLKFGYGAPRGWIGYAADYEVEGENEGAGALFERHGYASREEFVDNILAPSEISFSLTDEERRARHENPRLKVQAGCRLVKLLGLAMNGNAKASYAVVGAYVKRQRMDDVIEHVCRNTGNDVLEAAVEFAEKMRPYEPRVSAKAKRQLARWQSEATGEAAENLKKFSEALFPN